MTDPNKERFDAAARTWDENPGRVLLAEAVVGAILRRVPVCPEMEALDYGCGTGLVTLLIAPRVRSILGVDISEGMVSVLREKIDSQGIPNVSTAILDLRRDPPLDRRFDMITSSMTMHHIDDPSQVVGKLAAMLRPGGWLCIADLDAESGDFHADKTGVHHAGFARDRVREMFEAAGLESITLDTAYVFNREIEGVLREFPVFLACGCAPMKHLLQ
ncbi:MAG: class I SAM-dependent DNA methyltransferase [Armatimonadota bacterium]